MKTYIALLRGINVSGKKKIKMADLREQLAELKWNNIRTYIQSGNVLFETSETDRKKLEQQLHDKIEEHYDFQVPTLVLSADNLAHALETNPFLKDASNDHDRVYFTFLKDEPEQEKIDKLLSYSYPPEELVVDTFCVYGYAPEGYGNAKFSNNFIENKLKVGATTRNLKSVRKLLEMADEQN